MPKPDDVIYVHEPQEGLFLTGMPQRDLTQEDVDRLGPAMIQEAVATRLYRKATRNEKTEAAMAAEKVAAAQAKAEKVEPEE